MNRIIHVIVRRILTSALPFAAALLIAGCAPESTPEAFFPEEPGQAARTILDAQYARGARADAQLTQAHFDGTELNDMGRDKLARMLRDTDAALPLVVYVNAPDAARRADAVALELGDMGLRPEQFKVNTGPNPATAHPADQGIAALNKLNNPSTGSSTPADVPAGIPTESATMNPSTPK